MAGRVLGGEDVSQRCIGEFPVEFCKTKSRPRTWERKRMTSEFPGSPPQGELCQSHKTLPPQTWLCDSLVTNRQSILLSSPLFSLQCTCVLVGKHYHPPGCNREVFLLSVLIPLVKSNICYVLGTVLGTKNTSHTT